ncbi:hypothetical protein CBER1_10555 [Cercospora berteroae]|uniref:chitinase n=1 Tax=Cercospora berteroae TaxID=357750 RepID=A0A2S6CJ15_9PEZI|nr:hypothetical protein CBER1_10555 [Cercospora berteroae]
MSGQASVSHTLPSYSIVKQDESDSPAAAPSDQICREGSCRSSTTSDLVEICASQKWQTIEVGHQWICLDGALDLTRSTASTTSVTTVPDAIKTTSDHPSTAPQVTRTSSQEAIAPANQINGTHIKHSGMKKIAYYPSWGVYAREFFPRHITRPDRFTHIFYAFAKVTAGGRVLLGDPMADLEISDSQSASLGCIKQLHDLKEQSPGLKIILSVGGYSNREAFALPASSSDGRETFADSAVKLMQQYGFDGLDIDWEYPQSETEGANFSRLLALIRDKLDQLSTGDFLLSAAVSVDSAKNYKLPLKDMDAVLDLWILMGYDYATSDDNDAAHAANVYASNMTEETPFNADAAVTLFADSGVSISKLILGMPLYGHDFIETDGPGHPFKYSSKGSWDTDNTGIWDYKSIPISADAVVELDSDIMASWSYDARSRTMISFDNTEIAALKARYIMERGLGGAMWWEITGDQPSGSGHSIVDAVIEEFEGEGIISR